MERICPKCGALSSSKKFFGDFCEDCYLGMIHLNFPMSIELRSCHLCGKVRAARWEQLGRDVLESIVKECNWQL